MVEAITQGAGDAASNAEDLPARPQILDQTQDGVGFDIQTAVFDRIDRRGRSLDAVLTQDGRRDLVLERTEMQRPGPVMADQEVDRGVAQIAYAVEDDEGMVHVDKNSNKLGEVGVN